jgi:L-iditol 2-dehydrogenase
MSGSTMRAVMYLEPRHLELREVAVPEPASGEVIVRVEKATLCGTDLKGYKRGHRLFRPPMIFGHEYGGFISAVGEGVTRWREGDRVVAANSAPCNQCFYCKRGKHQLCVEIVDRMVYGAYADYVRVPAHIVEQNLHHVARDVPLEYACFTEPMACSVLCVMNAGIQLGDDVAIIGAGAQGLMLIQLAKLAGAGRVMVVGRSKGRLETAREIGADVLLSSLDGDPVEHVKSLTGGRGADVTIEAAGSDDTWRMAAAITRPGGTAILYSGLPAGVEVAFDAARLHYHEVTLKGVFHHTPRTVEMALRLIMTGRINVAPMLSGEIPLEQVEDGLLRMDRSEAIKLAVNMGLS